MIRLKFILLILGASLIAQASQRQFYMDCGAREAFAGQKILCQFILVSDEDFVDVEVVKFPEFRGFWSENTSMRQGPMGLAPVPTPKGIQKQVLVGSYIISKMLEKETSEIIPMKITVKSRSFSFSANNANTPPEILISHSLPLRLTPLPPIPKAHHSLIFPGAVGQFNSSQTPIIVNYRLEEPSQLRVTIEGRGNFAEINRLPLNFPKDTEIVSSRSFLQNMGDVTSKTFEISLLFKTPPPPSQDLGEFLFFNPITKSYQAFKFATVRFVETPNLEPQIQQRFELPEPEMSWSLSFQSHNLFFFWLTQAGLLSLLGFLVLQKQLKLKQLEKLNSPSALRLQKWAEAKKAQEQGNSEKFIQIATSLFTELLKEKSQSLPIRVVQYPTKWKLLKSSAAGFNSEQLKRLERLFEAYDHSFSPNSSSSLSPMSLQHLESDLTSQK
jgi:hypothetical protein